MRKYFIAIFQVALVVATSAQSSGLGPLPIPTPDQLNNIDRYIDSTLVYQGLEGGLGVDIVQEIAKKTIDLPLPDITFVLDIDPLQAQERLKKRKLATGEYTN